MILHLLRNIKQAEKMPKAARTNRFDPKKKKVSLSLGDLVLHPAVFGKAGLGPQPHQPAAVGPGSSSSPSPTSSEPFLRLQHTHFKCHRVRKEQRPKLSL